MSTSRAASSDDGDPHLVPGSGSTSNRMRTPFLGSPVLWSTRTPGVQHSPPRTPARAMSYVSEGGLSDFDEGSDLMLPASHMSSAAWTVDPNINLPENFILGHVDLTNAKLPDRLKSLMDDYAYWLSLVERLGFDKYIFRFDSSMEISDVSYVPSLEVLSRYYDSSHLGLLRVFHIFDKDKDALITRAEIAQGLKQQGFYSNCGSQCADLAFNEFCDLITRRSSSTVNSSSPSYRSGSISASVVSPPEFLLALRCLRLAAVVHGYMHPTHKGSYEHEFSRDIVLHYHEYREDKISAHLPLEGPISFLFRSPEDELGSLSRVHWIHAHEPTTRTVLALGVKYGLDPRFTLDVLSLWNQQALVDRSLSYVARSREHEGVSAAAGSNIPIAGCSTNTINYSVFIDREWIFTVFPVLKLSEESAATIPAFSNWRREDLKRGLSKTAKFNRPLPPDVFVEVEQCNVAIFVSGQALGGTAISFSTVWSLLGEVDTSNDLALIQETKGGHVESLDEADVTGDKSSDFSTHDFRAFSRLMPHLRTSYSHLRTGDAHTLYLKALWDITEDYVAVVEAYESVLTILRLRLDKKLDSLEQFEVQRIQACLKQTSQILRIVRPVSAVVHMLEAREWTGDSALYLNDLKANVSRFIDHACTVRETAKLLSDQYRNYCETRARRVLFLLTLITTIFVPCVFVTALEGMNFPGMPELHLKYSYLYFWIVIFSIVSSLLFFYRKKKWI